MYIVILNEKVLSQFAPLIHYVTQLFVTIFYTDWRYAREYVKCRMSMFCYDMLRYYAMRMPRNVDIKRQM